MDREDVVAETVADQGLVEEYQDVISKLAMIDEVEKNLMHMSRDDLKVRNTDR